MYILFDIGGTHIRVAGSKDGLTFSEHKRVRTPASFTDSVELFRTTVREVALGEKIEAVGGGIAGVIDFNTKRLVYSPHLSDWVMKPLEELGASFSPNFFVENDAAIAGLGEAVFGGGRGDKIVAYITISTGVGGARIVRGRISDRFLGFEPGHQILNMKTGETLENLVSGTAIQQKYNVIPTDITDPKVWEELGEIAGIGIHNTILHWSPELVIIGGSITLKSPQLFFDTINKSVHAHMKAFPTVPHIRKATLGDQSGLWGALAFIQKMMSARQEGNLRGVVV